jgi:hypothetical protein
MNGRRYVSAWGAIALVFALASAPAALQRSTAAAQTPVETALEEALIRVHLYFSGPDHTSLVAETRDLPNSGDPSELGKNIVQALIDGPRGKGVRTLPASAAVRDVFITDDGTAYVDFNEKVTEDHPGGVRTELVSIYSVVNSLVLNLEGISAVKLLIGGREADTLAGHIDLRFPYKANILLVK